MMLTIFKQKKAIFSLILGFLALGLAFYPATALQAASGNLIKNPSFEQGSVDTYWVLWNNQEPRRTYTMFRSYDVPFGAGSYSAAIEATGNPTSLYDAGMVTNSANNPFSVTTGKTYHLSFYTKATSPMTISTYLHRADTYEPVAPVREISITNNWQRYQVQFQATQTANAALGIAFGNLTENGTIYFDDFNLSEVNYTLSTQEVRGFMGETKSLSINGGNQLTVDDVRIEVPYFNPNTNTMERKQFVPSEMRNGSATFTIPANTFSGVGKVYVYGGILDEFTYNVFVKVTGISPDPVLPDEDLVVYGSGFHPDLTQNFVLVKSRGANGSSYDAWLHPHTVDANLSQLVVKLPVGMLNNKLSVRTYFTNKAGASVENRSNGFDYKIEPVIYGWEWKERGHEQVGDKIIIYGKGIIDRPTVNFYNSQNEVVARKSASINKIVTGTENYEVIETQTPVNLNQVTITVTAGPYESDPSGALSFVAKPTITSISAGHSRTLANNNLRLPAAKIGEQIRLVGNGFKTSSTAYVEFWSLHGVPIVVPIDQTHIDTNGRWVEVIVPAGAINGQVNVKINGQKSNNYSLEIIPILVSSQPIEPIPGQNLTLTLQGVSLDPSQITIRFKAPNSQEVAIHPSSVVKTGDNVVVTVLTPRALPASGTTLRVQSGYWLNDETYEVAVAPRIDSADINRATKTLTLRGSGFAVSTRDNHLTFKYADGTEVAVDHRIENITNTSSGQEMKVKINDGFYYGFVYLTVDENQSNQVSVGPAMVSRIERRIQYVQAENRVMGVLYISGRNFGPSGDVKVGDVWATTHYRTNTFIIAVVEQEHVYDNPVIVTKR